MLALVGLAAATLHPRPVGCAIAFLGLPFVPVEYAAAVHAARSLLAVGAQYVRPSCYTRKKHAMGPDLSDVKAARRVLVDDDPLAHVEAASSVRFPDAAASYELPKAMLEAVDLIIGMGDGLPAFRARQGQALLDIVESLSDLDALCASRMPAHVAWVAGGVRVASMAVLVEATGWPSVRLPSLFCHGFPTAGDGSPGEPGMSDSGVYRSEVRPAAFSLRDLATGQAKGFFNNLLWLGRACGTLRRRASDAAGDPDAMAALSAAETLCDKECRAQPRPTMMPPLTLSELTRWAADSVAGGLGAVRVMISFVVRQGLRPDGTPKYRRIDDGKQAGLNGATRTMESVTLISFLFPILVARAFVASASRRGVPCPRLWLGLDDLRAAYRVVPVAAIHLSVIAIWSVKKARVLFFRLPGHAFGLVASVCNFSQFAHFVCHVTLVFFLVVVDHYVDDFIFTDPASAESSAHDALRLVLLMLGFDVELDKRQWAAPSNVVLGVLVSVATAHVPGGAATAAPTADRVAKILDRLREAAERKSLSSGEAQTLFGKLSFTLLPVNLRIGRAACQSISRRASGKDRGSRWNPALATSLRFFERVLPRLPPLSVSMLPRRERPLLIYTDAAFHTEDAKPVASLGFYVYDPISKEEYRSSLELPQSYYVYLAPDKETYVAQAELAVAVAVYYSLPDVCRGRHVLHFIDNVGAMGALVKGYDGRSDNAALVSCFHEIALDLKTNVWFEWVPSLANISDWMTRPDKAHLIPVSAVHVDTVLPPVHVFVDMLKF